MPAKVSFRAVALGAFLVLTGCGSGRTLESITVVPGTSGIAYTATGHYSDGSTQANIQVAWFETGAVVDPYGPNWNFTMTTAPFKGSCTAEPAQFVIVAYAPANSSARASGSMPFTVFETLVEQHSVKRLDGFVSGTAPIACNTASLRMNAQDMAAGF
ncbi:MAG TPA: hypothetical protein VHX60_16870 [Acidobacteriaceae bacterium]|jgi:hypothetical protein|nr:hypothetical protein [Acidobacteriaceae bacterium]